MLTGLSVPLESGQFNLQKINSAASSFTGTIWSTGRISFFSLFERRYDAYKTDDSPAAHSMLSAMFNAASIQPILYSSPISVLNLSPQSPSISSPVHLYHHQALPPLSVAIGTRFGILPVSLNNLTVIQLTINSSVRMVFLLFSVSSTAF